ncbi:MAG: Gfo/Idh/MocA family oxidoreductase, partial [Candidatus Andersenbacteria bacterium]
MLKTVVIGLGRQSLEDHIPAVLESGSLNLVAVCDVDSAIVRVTEEKFGVQGFSDVKELVSKV